MFTGIVEEIGQVNSVVPVAGGRKISIRASRILDDLKIEDSVSINGACQTVVDVSSEGFAVEAVGDTLEKTTLGMMRAGSPVNLERALTLQTRLGGHLVAGHVNDIAKVVSITPQGNGVFYRIRIKPELLKYCVPEGSITVDGVSLTIAAKEDDVIRLSLIPHTVNNTIFQYYRSGTSVNIEVDIIAKYLEALLQKRGDVANGISFDKLEEWGF